jgi:hypothetical protein
MDWSKKLLYFVCLPMFAIAGVSYFVGASLEEEAGYSDEAAAKSTENPDYYYDDKPKSMEWEDAGAAAGDGDGDHYFDEDYHEPAYYDGDDDDDDDDHLDEEIMWLGETEVSIDEPPPEKDDGWPWMTIMTAGIGSLTGLISAISSLVKNIAKLRRKEEEDDNEDEAPAHE